MRALVVLALVSGAVAVAAPAAATVYVPGQYKDGIYIRPHFLDGPGQAPVVPLLLPPDLEAAKAKEAQGLNMLQPEAVPQKHPPLPAS
ncbi:MAG TPA: hypothetical protein VF031_03655 [Alphaproteobacteria bacterium]